MAKPLNFWRRTHEGSQRSRTAPQALEILEGLEVFKFISKNVQLGPHTRRNVLQQQLKRWARIAYEQDLDEETRDTIYKQILLCHPEIGSATFRRITLPFIYYYLAVPLKRIPFVVGIHEKLKRAVRWFFKKPK